MTDFDLPAPIESPEDGIDRPIGILSAVPEEDEAFKGSFDEIEAGEHGGFSVRHGMLEGKPVVLMRCGVGKVNAASAAISLIRDFYCGSIIVAGVAGALDECVAVGDVVIGRKLIQHDYGALIDGHIKAFQPGVLPLPGNEGALGYSLPIELQDECKRLIKGMDLPPLSRELTGGEFRLPKCHMGVIVTGDTFVNCKRTGRRLAFEFGAIAVEMEGAAVAQVCERLGHRWMVVRGVSDMVGEASHVSFPAFARDVSVTVGAVVKRLVTVI